MADSFCGVCRPGGPHGVRLSAPMALTTKHDYYCVVMCYVNAIGLQAATLRATRNNDDAALPYAFCIDQTDARHSDDVLKKVSGKWRANDARG